LLAAAVAALTLLACASAAPPDRHRPAAGASLAPLPVVANAPGGGRAGPEPPRPGEPQRSSLVPQAPVERALAGGARHEYRIPLPARSYLRVTIVAIGVDPTAVLLDGAGGTGGILASAVGADGWRSVKQLSVVAERGDYRIVVEAPDARDPGGRYALSLDALRPAAPSDEERVRAERAEAAARRAASEPAKEDWRQALAQLEGALATWRRIGSCGDEVRALNEIAQLDRLLGDSESGLAACGQARELARGAWDLEGEANALMECGQLVTAPERQRELFSEALRLREGMGSASALAESLYQLALALGTSRDFAEALPLYRRSYALLENGDLVARADRLVNLGFVLDKVGEPLRAYEALTEGLALSRKAGARAQEAGALYRLAGLQLERGYHQDAADFYRQAIETYHLVGDERQEAQATMELGVEESYLGEHKAARTQFSKALKLLDRLPASDSAKAYALTQLGYAERESGDLEAARRHELAALALSQGEQDKTHRMDALYELGRVHRALGQRGTARAYLVQAAALGTGPENDRAAAQVAVELAGIELDGADLAGAEQQVALALRLLGSRRGDLWIAAKAAQARLERDEGRLQVARTDIEEALEVVESQREGVLSPGRRITFFATRRTRYELLIDILMRLETSLPGQGYAAAAIHASERARARGLLDLLVEERSEAGRQAHPDLAQRRAALERQITGVQGEMIELSQRSPEGSDGPGLEDRLDGLREELRVVDEAIRRERTASSPRLEPLDLAGIQRLLDERTALLEYVVGSQGSYLLAVTRERLGGYRLEVSGRQLQKLTRQMAQALLPTGLHLAASYALAAHELYRVLVSPAAGLLAGKTRLLISPDGPLYSLNFECLLSAPGRVSGGNWSSLPYLVRDYAVSYVPSATVLAHLRTAGTSGARGGSFVGFGDPAYGTPEQLPTGGREPVANPAAAPALEGPAMRALRQAGLDRLPRLSYSAEEIAGIAGVFPAGRTYLHLGGEVNKETVRGGELQKAEWIHFATHGLLSDDPELSGLVLSRNPASRQIELLQMRDIFDLKLGADLVVLSACRTGLGEELRGEGLIGLPRAFLYAGAASVMVSLWQVDDRSTPRLMIAFYRRLLASGDAAAALQLAKLDLLQQSSSSFPYYWAPFILLGEPRQPSSTTGL
jgi:CHAT domain-containing protein/tetratricopeptide (TPR) repeat protein